MKCLQWIYTSFPKIGSEEGFRVYSQSIGISDNDSTFIRDKMRYSAPTNLNYMPEKNEIYASFPYNFSFFDLPSGNSCIALSTYVGKDYSNRYGNYFVHALILDKESLDVLPIHFFEGDFWRRELSSEELKIETVPEPLSILEVEPYNDYLDDASIYEFLTDGREENFKLLVNALMYALSSRLPLFINDQRDNLIYWIAALSKVLPFKLAKQLSFSTYISDSNKHPFVINCIPAEGCFFNYSSEAINPRHIVLDFENQVFSKNIPTSEFSEIAATAATISIELLFDFHDFVDGTSYDALNEEFREAYLSYQIISGQNDSLPIYTDMLAILKFTEKYCDNPVKTEIAEWLLSNIETYLSSVKIEDIGFLYTFLFSYSSHMLTEIYGSVVDMLYEFACTRDDATNEQLIIEIDNIQLEEPAFYNGLIDFLFTDYSLSRISTLVSGNPQISTNLFFSKLFSRYIQRRQKIDNNTVNCLLSITRNLCGIEPFESSIGTALPLFFFSKQLFATIIFDCYSVIATTQRNNLFIAIDKALSTQSHEWIESVENVLLKNKESIEMGIDLFMYRLERSKSITKDFWSFYSQYLCAPTGKSFDIEISPVLVKYLSIIDPRVAASEGMKIIERIDLNELNSSAISALARVFDVADVRSIDSSAMQNYHKLRNACTRTDVAFPQPLAALELISGIVLMSNNHMGNEHITNAITASDFNPNSLSKNTYDELLKEHLYALLDVMTSSECTEQIVSKFCAQKYGSVFWNRLEESLKRANKKKNQIWHRVVINLILATSNSTKESVIGIKQDVFYYLSKIDKDEKDILLDSLQREVGQLRALSIMDSINNAKRPSLFSIGNLFKKKDQS